VDLLLEHEDPTVSLLYQISAAHEEVRIRNGAVRVHRREVVPFLEADGSVRLLEIEEESPARSLVAEMMVLANSIMATFAAEHQIPVIFRGQERADGQESHASSNVPEGPAKDFSARSKLKKSTMTFEPRYHATLGLNAYTQCTSPIRRYMDLCHQRQILSFFKRNKPWMSRTDLEPLANEVEVHLNAATLAGRETRRYWLLRYLEGRPRGKTIQGTVVRQDTKSPLVELDEVYLTFFVKSSRPVRLGQAVTLKIGSVDPHADYLRLEVV
jgi:exoribonuclease-2